MSYLFVCLSVKDIYRTLICPLLFSLQRVDNGETMGIRLPKNPNPPEFDSRLGYRGLYKFLGLSGGFSTF